MWIVDISYFIWEICPQIFKCEIHRIPSLRSEDIHSSFLDGNRIPELKHENLLANSIFLVGNLMKVFQILNRQYSIFPEGKTEQRFLNKNWNIPYFMWGNLWPHFDMWNRHFLISCQSICLQIFITLPCTTSWTQFSDFTFTFHFHAFEKEMATHSSVLAWRIPGMGILVGCRLWGHTESDTTEVA